MKHLQLNRIAIWQPKATDELTTRESPAGRPYIKDNIFYKTEKPSFRIAKNYTTGRGKAKTKFCLFAITYRNDFDAIEKELDAIAKNIDTAQAQQATLNSTNTEFEWTEFELQEN